MTDLFPELRGGGGATDEVAASSDREDRRAVAIVLGPDGQVMRGGRSAIDRYNQLLGLPHARIGDSEVVVTGAEVSLGDGRIELSVAGGGLESTALRLVPCKPSRTHPDSFQVRLHGPVRSGVVRSLMERVERRLRGAPFGVLLKVVRLDPDRTIVTLARPPAERCDDGQFDRSVVRTYDGALAWRTFFADLEQQRNYSHQLVGKVLAIRHEDLECGYATPRLCDGTPSFFSYAKTHQSPGREGPEGRRSGEPAKRSWGWADLATDLRDQDVIKGGAAKVEAILDQVAGWEDKPDLVMVKTACVPKVIGDDLSPAIERFEARTGVPTIFVDNLADEHADAFSALLERLRWGRDLPPIEQRRGRINLVGYPNVPAMARLEGSLETLGVTINARLVPEVLLDHMERYPRAELQVLFDSRLYQPTFEQLFGTIDIPTLRPPLPYGVSGSRAWLASVAGALGKEGGLEALWEAQWAPHEDPWSHLTTMARDHCLGFVVDRHGAELLLHPQKSTGVPILSVLQEMGFGLELLCFEGDGDSAPVAALPGHSVVFHDVAELEARLRASAATAFYSEFSFDRRLSRCGKAQFSVAAFEPGIEGAFVTLRELLRICRLPFYRRYARYLGPAFAGPAREAR
ncbi:MAG: hypothetical protein JRI68_25720 [Deltaproteobacteria bacterium]|nr:hypothetical protein [Deltaproteobacteria bacterium]